MTDYEKEKNPSYSTKGGYLKNLTYKESWSLFWKNAEPFEKQIILKLPHFDKNIFLEITGIDVSDELTK